MGQLVSVQEEAGSEDSAERFGMIKCLNQNSRTASVTTSMFYLRALLLADPDFVATSVFSSSSRTLFGDLGF